MVTYPSTDALIDEMKQVFGSDRKRIDHALAVLDYARRIQAAEGGDRFVVEASAVLHDIGIHQAERKYGSCAGIYQEIEGPPIAQAILAKYHVPENDVDHICRIIANHHTARDADSTEFRIVWDADWLVNIPVEYGDFDVEKLEGLIEKVFKTSLGRRIAIESFLKTRTGKTQGKE